MEPVERAGAPVVEETWSAEAGYHQDGTDRDGILG